MVDRELCVRAADRALAYLRERVLDDTWVAAHRDIAYYFKAPQAFLLAGLRDEAAAAFDALEPFLDEGGAASGSAAYRLAYPHYPYMWAAKAARELGRTAAIINDDPSTAHFIEVTAACDAKLSEWRLEKAHGDRDGDGFGVVGGDADFFATAMRAFNAITFRRVKEARSAATLLMWAIHRQEGDEKFRLRWDAATSYTSAPAWASPPAEGGLPSVFYEVDRTQPGQLYFMLAFPAMVLLELHTLVTSDAYRATVASAPPIQYENPVDVVDRLEDSALDAYAAEMRAVLEVIGTRKAMAENEHEYLGAARRLLAFLRSCDGINESLFAHKAAVAAAMAGERDTAGTISEYLLSQQRAHGGFADDADAMDTVDQTAELACWLRMLPELAAATEPASLTVAGF